MVKGKRSPRKKRAEVVAAERKIARTLVILKPDAVRRSLAGTIIARLENAGLTLREMRMGMATNAELLAHFPWTNTEWLVTMGERAVRRVKDELLLKPKKFYGTDDPYKVGEKIWNGCCAYYASGPLIPLVLEGEDAVLRVRKLIGNTLPSKAEKGTIRGDFGIPEDLEKFCAGAAENLIHASDSDAEAEREIRCWFPRSPLARVLTL